MKKPIIGVIPLWDEQRKSLWMLPGYPDGIRETGGLPVILPLEGEAEDLLRLYALCDGLLLTGGQDVDPALYGAPASPLCGERCPKRDRLEPLLFRRAMEDDKPVLGICRGIQLMNVLLGGTLYQDLPAQLSGCAEHHMAPPYDRTYHAVNLETGGLLRSLLGVGSMDVNSCHHQGIRTVASPLRVEATAPDGLVEAVSCPGRRFLLGVQWHPEFSFRTDPFSTAIFRVFVDRCRGAANP